MQIFRELAGFSFGQADNVRRAMSKKKHAVMEAEREHFVHGCTEPGHECPGCVANGISEKVANEIYDEMSSFASYAFNKSHAACYAYVAFQTAYLKCHYPSEFMAALLTSVLDNTDKVIEYSGECARLGIRVLPPDINISNGGFTADAKGQIRFGLNAVKSVGRNLVERIVEERGEKPYASLYDFCKRLYGNEMNRRAVESLVKAGAFDSMGENRHSLVEAVDGIIKSVESDSRRNLDGQLDLFSLMSGGAQSASKDVYEIRHLEEYSHTELLQQEKEVSAWAGQRPCPHRLHHCQEPDDDHQVEQPDGLYQRGRPDRHDGGHRLPEGAGGLPGCHPGKCRCGHRGASVGPRGRAVQADG